MTHTKYVMLTALGSMICAAGLSAQGVSGQGYNSSAPTKILSKTRPPSGGNGQSQNGAGDVFLPDGTRLVTATSSAAASSVKVTPYMQQGWVPEDVSESVKGIPHPGDQPDQAAAAMKTVMASAAGAIAGGPDGQGGPSGPAAAGGGGMPPGMDSIMGMLGGAMTKGGKKNAYEDSLEGSVDPSRGVDAQAKGKASQIAQANQLALVPAGTIITIRNYTRMSTVLGGTVVAFIDHDVKDAQMRSVVIPRGSKLLGVIQPVGGPAQSRLGVVFREIVDPEGNQIQLMVPAPVVDRIGAGGIPGKVDQHWGLKFGVGIAYAVVGGLVAPQGQQGGLQGNTFGQTVQTNVASQMGSIGQKAMEQYLAIPPDIEVAENTSMRIILGGPIYAKPWRVIRPF